MNQIFLAMCFFLSLSTIPLVTALDVDGRIEVDYALADIDILESGKTVETLHMRGIKADAIFIFYKGICLKPGLILLGNDGQFSVFSIAAGQYLPITKRLSLLPSVGISWSYLHTRIDIPEIQLFHLHEKFRSSSPFISLELAWKLSEKWYLHGLVQYAWSRTHTTIKPIVSQTSHSDGPNYGLGLEYAINKKWSLTLGAGYNITLSHEKHGLRAKGLKLGVATYF